VETNLSDQTLAYEDFHPGRRFALGPVTVSAEEIIEFASEFDPQPMHTDEAAGRASILGGRAKLEALGVDVRTLVEFSGH
jgi:acyl dehydratase